MGVNLYKHSIAHREYSSVFVGGRHVRAPQRNDVPTVTGDRFTIALLRSSKIKTRYNKSSDSVDDQYSKLGCIIISIIVVLRNEAYGTPSGSCTRCPTQPTRAALGSKRRTSTMTVECSGTTTPAICFLRMWCQVHGTDACTLNCVNKLRFNLKIILVLQSIFTKPWVSLSYSTKILFCTCFDNVLKH